MHLLYVSNGYSRHDQNFLTALGKSISRLSFLALNMSPKQRAVFSNEIPGNATLVELKDFPADLQTAFPQLASLSRLLAHLKPDATLAGPLHSGAFACALAKSEKLVSMSWAFDILVDGELNVALGEANRYALQHSCGLIYDSEAVAAQIRSIARGDLQLFRCPWGVDLTQYSFAAIRQRDLMASLGWTENDLIFSNRNWFAAYDVVVAIHAFAEAHSRNDKLRMILAGDGPLREEIEQEIRSFRLQDSVLLARSIDRAQTVAYLHAADVFLSCAPSDGSSVSLLEAMACGALPIVVDAPGNREWLSLKTGWLVPAKQPGRFAEAIESAFEMDESGRTARALTNRQIVESRADWAANSARLIAFLHKIADK